MGNSYLILVIAKIPYGIKYLLSFHESRLFKALFHDVLATTVDGH